MNKDINNTLMTGQIPVGHEYHWDGQKWIVQPMSLETLRAENALLRADVERWEKQYNMVVNERNERAEKANTELFIAQAQRDQFVDYSLWLQRLVEHLCRGIPVTEDITFHAPYHAQMAKNKQAEEATRAENAQPQKDSEYLTAYIKMVQEKFPYTPYWNGSHWACTYLSKGEGGFGGGVSECGFDSFRAAMDSALEMSFPS